VRLVVFITVLDATLDAEYRAWAAPALQVPRGVKPAALVSAAVDRRTISTCARAASGAARGTTVAPAIGTASTTAARGLRRAVSTGTTPSSAQFHALPADAPESLGALLAGSAFDYSATSTDGFRHLVGLALDGISEAPVIPGHLRRAAGIVCRQILENGSQEAPVLALAYTVTGRTGTHFRGAGEGCTCTATYILASVLPGSLRTITSPSLVGDSETF
jgi:hypothetical protein